MAVPETAAPHGQTPPSTWASRVPRARWRDPRLILGLLLVVASVLAGARLLSTADDYVEVWSASRDLAAGSELHAEDLQVRKVRFAEQADADRYVAANVAPVGAVLARPLGAGELLPRAALRTAQHKPVAELPLGVAEEGVPSDLANGDVVDVWVVPDANSLPIRPAIRRQSRTAASGHAERVLSGVVVLSAGDDAATFGSAGVRTIVVAVGAKDKKQLPSMLPALAAGEVMIVRVGG